MYIIKSSGYSAAWLARHTGGVKVESSNPSTPTIFFDSPPIGIPVGFFCIVKYHLSVSGEVAAVELLKDCL